MSGRFANNAASKSNYLIIPPLNFCYIEDTLCRCSMPISRNSISFLHSISVGCIINVSGKKLDSGLMSYCEEQGILIKSFLADGEEIPISISKFEEWVAEKLATIVSQSCSTNTLLVGSTDNFLDCVLIACLRKLHDWSFVSIISEFRHQVWPNKLFDYEQLIEHFDKRLVDLSVHAGEYLLTHDSLQKEEAKMKERLRVIDEERALHRMSTTTTPNAATSTSVDPEESTPSVETIFENKLSIQTNDESSSIVCNPSVENKNSNVEEDEIKRKMSLSKPSPVVHDINIVSEQERVDRILNALFFSNGNKLLSDGIEFDPNLSLINDKDEED